MATSKHLEQIPPKNYDRIAAIVPNLRRASFLGVTQFLRHSTTIELLSLLVPLKEPHPSLRISPLYWEVVISLVAAIARKFMRSRHVDRYLQPKPSLTAVSAK